MLNATQHPLLKYMQERGLNNHTAGEFFGCSDTTIARIIADDRPPAAKLMQRIIDLSGGELLPNMFYVLPEAEKEEASHA